MKYRQIKFTCTAKKWFDKVNGNTYHSVRVTRHKDGAVIVGQFQYGYGESYKGTALAMMAKARWLGKIKYQDFDKQFQYERKNNYPILWTVSEGLKRDCVANGIL